MMAQSELVPLRPQSSTQARIHSLFQSATVIFLPTHHLSVFSV